MNNAKILTIIIVLLSLSCGISSSQPVTGPGYHGLESRGAVSGTDIQLDSIHEYDWDYILNDWKFRQRQLYKYDEKGHRLSLLTVVSMDNGMTWRDFKLLNYTYDNKGNMTYHEWLSWNSDSAKLINYYRYYYKNYYDNEGRTVSSLVYRYYPDGPEWALMGKDSTRYNRYNRMIEDIDFNTSTGSPEDRMCITYWESHDTVMTVNQVWDEEEQDWINIDMEKRIMDTANFQIFQIHFNWSREENKWIPFFRQATGSIREMELMYDSVQHWNRELGRWIGTSRTINTFNDKELITESAGYHWNNTTNEWFIDRQVFYYYDLSNHLDSSHTWERTYPEDPMRFAQKKYYETDGSGNITSETTLGPGSDTSWIAVTRFNYSRDNNGYLTEYEKLSYDFTREKWKGDSRTSRVYDQYGNYLLEIEYWWNEDTWEWDYDKKEIYFRSEQDYKTAWRKVPGDDYPLVFPNPTTGRFRVQLRDGTPQDIINLQVYSASGILVYRDPDPGTGSGIIMADLSQLPSGLYVLVLKTKSTVTTAKIIKY